MTTILNPNNPNSFTVTADKINYVRLVGKIVTKPKLSKTKESCFITFLRLTEGLKTDYHEIKVYEYTSAFSLTGQEFEKGSSADVKGTLTYQNKEIKDDEGKVIAKIKEACIVAASVNLWAS